MPISEAEMNVKKATMKPTEHNVEAVHLNVGLSVDGIRVPYKVLSSNIFVILHKKRHQYACLSSTITG